MDIFLIWVLEFLKLTLFGVLFWIAIKGVFNRED